MNRFHVDRLENFDIEVVKKFEKHNCSSCSCKNWFLVGQHVLLDIKLALFQAISAALPRICAENLEHIDTLQNNTLAIQEKGTQYQTGTHVVVLLIQFAI